MNIKYTICFIYRENSMLMLFRLKSPNLHKWNGVGGKIDVGETPLESIIREVKEETGLTIKNPRYRGVVSWNNIGGMHVYSTNEYSGILTDSAEGPLEWKTFDWIKQSPEVVSNIPIFFRHLLTDDNPVEYAFTYNQKGQVVDVNIMELKTKDVITS